VMQYHSRQISVHAVEDNGQNEIIHLPHKLLTGHVRNQILITLGTDAKEESIVIFNDIRENVINPYQIIEVHDVGCLCEVDIHPTKMEFVVISTSGLFFASTHCRLSRSSLSYITSSLILCRDHSRLRVSRSPAHLERIQTRPCPCGRECGHVSCTLQRRRLPHCLHSLQRHT
jgi:hypothetical protein